MTWINLKFRMFIIRSQKLLAGMYLRNFDLVLKLLSYRYLPKLISSALLIDLGLNVAVTLYGALLFSQCKGQGVDGLRHY